MPEPSKAALERNMVRCSNCTRLLGLDYAGLSIQRTHDYEWVGLVIQMRCRCGQVMGAAPDVLAKLLTVLGELFPRLSDEARAALLPVDPDEKKAA